MVEKTLAVDNIFVFVVVFSFFAIPASTSTGCCSTASSARCCSARIFIALGSALMQYHGVIVFGAFLILTGVKMLFAAGEADRPGTNPLIRLLRRFLPVTPNITAAFFVRRGRAARDAAVAGAGVH